MKDIRIYNFDKSKDTDVIYSLTKYARDVKEFYISRSWELGPHIVITFGETTSLETIEDIKQKLEQDVRMIHVSEVEQGKIRQQYMKSVEAMAALEKKDVHDGFNHHGTVVVVDNAFHYYNTQLTNLIHQMRFELQPLLTDVYWEIHGNANFPMEALSPVLFHGVSESYKKDQQNKGYFSFISHVHGFFELSKKQSLSFSEEQFEQLFQKNLPAMERATREKAELIEVWTASWKKLFDDYKSLINGQIDEAYKTNIVSSFSDLEEGFTNDFHKRFVEYAKSTDFVNDQDATIYRFVINVLYLSLPFLKISALKKQLFIYMSYRYTEESYGTNWRKEIKVTV